ncbi:YfbU family protein [Aeromonas veronii]|uniref:YfbU family protein n=1 Tax=Aeromonas veronii TaxID=654 RepID=UPI001F3DFD02|nr:YfbU family protein [Aeromonas veronii]MCF7742248.1 YfbU family protein [Aeromonas veronii]
MNFTPEQRLIVSLLCDIHQKLEIADSFDSRLISDAINTGNEWAIGMTYGDGLGDTSPLSEECSFVCNVLHMSELIETVFSQMDAEQKAETRRLTDFNPEKVFYGFDGNNETDLMSIARFLVTRLHKFTHFTGREFNSHMPSVGAYRRMLVAFDEVMEKGPFGLLTPQNIATILNEKRHPDNR